MAHCLITKLDANVNDNTLPVLETMQQFTLDAIAASGNAAMTDAQKAALNHFFYQVGAIENNALWGKMVIVALPMICNKNLAKALVNYKGNIIEETPTSEFWSFSANGGLTCVNTSSHITFTTKYVGSSASVSAAIATMKTYLDNRCRLWRLGNSSSILNNYFVGYSSNSPDYIYNCRGAAYYVNSEDLTIDVAGMRCQTDRSDYKGVSSSTGGTISGADTTLSGVKAETVFDSTTGRIQLTAGDCEYGAMVLSSLLSESEMDTVLMALKQLKVAFL